MTDPTYGPHTRAWRALQAHAKRLAGASIADLFAADAGRFEELSLDSQGLLLDFSRQRLDVAALRSLLDLAEETEVPRWIELMFSGFPVNNTEDRAALHVALRRPADQPLRIDGENVMPAVEAELRNVGPRAGAEVAQLYLDFPDLPGTPKIALRGFQRVGLAPGERTQVRFALTARDLSAVDPDGVRQVMAGNYRVFVGSGQPGTGVPVSEGAFSVAQPRALPR